MKVAYFVMVGVLCTVVGSEIVYAETPEVALAKENMHGVIVGGYAQCPEDHHPSKYLDNIYGGTRCYQCLNGMTWNNRAQNCS